MKSDIIFYSYFLIVSVPECFGKYSNSSDDEAVQHVDQNFGLPAHDESQSSLPWISEIFAEAEKSFTISHEASVQCRNDFEKYELHLRNNSLWAVRMYESSQWPRVGLLKGSSPSLGHFDQCTAINAYGIKGRHCLVESVYDLSKKFSIRPAYPLDEPSEENSVWLALEKYKNDKHRFERNKLVWTLCAPSSCSTSDLHESLERTLKRAFEKYSINVTTTIEDNWCHSDESAKSEYYYHVKYFLSILIAIVVLSSVIHSRQIKVADNGVLPSILNCFSIQKNYRKLVDFEPNREHMLIHFQKVVFTLLTTAVHIWAFEFQFLRYDADVTEQFSFFVNEQSISSSGPESVDMMFAYSGLLMYESFIRSESKKDNIASVIMMFIKRWLRLFSTYVVVRLFYAHILPTLSNGVLWHEVEDDTAFCRSSMLPALLTLPSARSDTACIISSWQIAVDFQLFCLTYLWLFLCRRHKINAVKAILSLMAAFAIFSLGSNFFNHHILLIFFNLRRLPMDRKPENLTFMDVHVSTVNRVIPYLIGCLIAEIAHQMKLKQRAISKVQALGGWVSTSFIKIWLGTYAYRFHLRPAWNIEHTPVRDVIFATFYCTLRNLSDYFVTFTYLVNGFQFLEKRIPRFVVPLSRLTYSFVLTHFIVILPRIFSKRTVPAFSALSAVHSYVSDITLTYMLSFFVYLLIEAPVQSLISRFLNDTKKVENEQPKDTDDRILKKEN